MNLTDSITKEAKSYFEANLLDGDDIKDCGGAMIRAEYVYDEFVVPFLKQALNKAYEEGYQARNLEIVKQIQVVLSKVKKKK